MYLDIYYSNPANRPDLPTHHKQSYEYATQQKTGAYEYITYMSIMYLYIYYSNPDMPLDHSPANQAAYGLVFYIAFLWVYLCLEMLVGLQRSHLCIVPLSSWHQQSRCHNHIPPSTPSQQFKLTRFVPVLGDVGWVAEVQPLYCPVVQLAPAGPLPYPYSTFHVKTVVYVIQVCTCVWGCWWGCRGPASVLPRRPAGTSRAAVVSLARTSRCTRSTRR